MALGVVGALAIAALWFARRGSLRVRSWSPLPATVSNTVATTVFAAAGVWLSGLGLEAWISHAGQGTGQWLSAAPVTLIAALVFGVRLVRNIQTAD